MERIVNGDPDHPLAAVIAKNGENLMEARHLTEARQDAYRDEHGGNNACDLNYLEPLGRDDELTGHVRNSHYAVKLICTGADDQGRAAHYAVTAYPRTESNPPNAPIYCLDESKIIRRYSNENDLNAVVSYQRLSCPEDGQPVQ